VILINVCLLQTQTRAQGIVNELFPPGLPASVKPGAVLDALVTRLSQEMIDDYPASDPRWAESLPPGHYTTVTLLYLPIVVAFDPSQFLVYTILMILLVVN